MAGVALQLMAQKGIGGLAPDEKGNIRANPMHGQGQAMSRRGRMQRMAKDGPYPAVAKGGNDRSQRRFTLGKLSLGQLEVLASGVRDDEAMRTKNVRFGLWSIMCIILMIVDEESRWDYGDQYPQGLYNRADAQSWVLMDFVIPACNLVGLAMLIDIYSLFSRLKMEKWLLPSRWKAFWNTSLKWQFFAEAFVAMAQPMPWAVYQLKFSGDSWLRFMGMLMFMRFYTIGRIFRDNSSMYRLRHQAREADFHLESSVKFMVTMRAELRAHPLRSLAFILATILTAFTYVIFVLEREARYELKDPDNPPKIDSAPKALWFVVATLTTVGYGDMFPSTSKGYYPAIAEGLVGMVVTSLLVAVVINRVSMDEHERKLLEWVEGEEDTWGLRNASSSLIGIFARHYIWSRDHPVLGKDGRPLPIMRLSSRNKKGQTFMQASRKFIKKMRHYAHQRMLADSIGINHSDSNSQIVTRLNKVMDDQITAMDKLQMTVNTLADDLDRSLGRTPRKRKVAVAAAEGSKAERRRSLARAVSRRSVPTVEEHRQKLRAAALPDEHKADGVGAHGLAAGRGNGHGAAGSAPSPAGAVVAGVARTRGRGGRGGRGGGAGARGKVLRDMPSQR